MTYSDKCQSLTHISQTSLLPQKQTGQGHSALSGPSQPMCCFVQLLFYHSCDLEAVRNISLLVPVERHAVTASAVSRAALVGTEAVMGIGTGSLLIHNSDPPCSESTIRRVD